MNRLEPPSGAEPPHSAKRKSGEDLPLDPIARAVCDEYFAEFPDDRERYGPAGDQWCVHDTLYLLAWAIAEHDWSDLVLDDQVRWLADVLAARNFPLEQLARHLNLAAVIVAQRGDDGVAALLQRSAETVRGHKAGEPAARPPG